MVKITKLGTGSLMRHWFVLWCITDLDYTVFAHLRRLPSMIPNLPAAKTHLELDAR